jgi:hypothetical protein
VNKCVLIELPAAWAAVMEATSVSKARKHRTIASIAAPYFRPVLNSLQLLRLFPTKVQHAVAYRTGVRVPQNSRIKRGSSNVKTRLLLCEDGRKRPLYTMFGHAVAPAICFRQVTGSIGAHYVRKGSLGDIS